MDEFNVLDNVFHYIQYSTIVPAVFVYPPLFSYLSLPSTYVGAFLLSIQGVIPSPHDFLALYELNSILAFLPARFTSAFFGVATLFIVFLTGKRFYGPKTGLFGLAILAFSKLHIHYSGYVLPEATLTFFAACTFYLSLSSLMTGSLRHFVLAGMFAGLTAATKYNGVLVFVSVLAVHAILLRREKLNILLLAPAWTLNRRFLSTLASFTLAFLFSSPGFLAKPVPFIKSLILHSHYMSTGWFGFFGPAYLQHLKLLWFWEGPIAFLFVFVVFYVLVRRDSRDLVLVSTVLLSFLYIGLWKRVLLHYLIFTYPALALLSGRMLSDLFQKIGCINRSLSFVFVFIVLIFPALSSVAYSLEYARADSRRLANDWVQDNIPNGSILVVDWAYLPPLLDKDEVDDMFNASHALFYQDRLSGTRSYHILPIKYNVSWISTVRAQYLLTNDFCFNRFLHSAPPPRDNPLYETYLENKKFYETVIYEPEVVGWVKLKEFHTGNGPRIILYQRNVSQ